MDEANSSLTATSLSASLPAVCRTCLTKDVPSDPELELYQIDEIFLEEDELTSQVHSFEEVLSLFVNDGIGKQDDRLPKLICLTCVEKARAAFQFIEMCRVTDSLLEECLSKEAKDTKPVVKADQRETEEDTPDDFAEEEEPLNEQYEEVDHPESTSVDGLTDYTDQVTKEKFTLMYVEDKPEKKRSSAKTGSPKRNECDICHKTFTQPQTLTRHKKIHTRSKDPGKPCEYCSKTFTRSDDLKRHIRTHTNERPYVCDQCPRSYKQSFELKEHKQSSHSTEGIRKMACTVCGKQLTTRNGLYVHMKAHRGEKNHACLYCGRRFVTSGELTSHLRHSHPKEVNVKFLACGVGDCTRKFVTNSARRVHHVRKHAAEMSRIESGSD